VLPDTHPIRRAEIEAQAMAQKAQQHGHAFLDGSWGRIRVTCTKTPERTWFFLNHLPLGLRACLAAMERNP